MLFLFEEIYFLFLTEGSEVKPVKFSLGSGCLVRDEFLVIFKGDHVLIYVYIFEVCHCWALYCTALRSFNLIYLGSIFSVALLESCDNFPESYHVLQNDHFRQPLQSKGSFDSSESNEDTSSYHVQNLQLLRHENILVVWMTVIGSFWRARRCSSVESGNVPLHPQ